MRQPIYLPIVCYGMFICVVGLFSLMSGIAPSMGIGWNILWVKFLVAVFGFRGMRIISTVLGVVIIAIGVLTLFRII